MRSKRRSIIISAIFSLMLIAGSAVPAHAETKEYLFDLLVIGTSQTKYNVQKAGGSKFEKKFYITQILTQGPENCGIKFYYHPRYNGSKAAKNVKLPYSKTTVKGNNDYLSGQAVAGRKYQLRCKSKSSIADGEYSWVRGKWTP